MKNFLPLTRVLSLLIILMGASALVNAQELFGLTSTGGANHSGTIIKANHDGTGFTKVYDFVDATGSTPVGTMVQGKGGIWYGNCQTGGADGSCTLFSFNATTGEYNMLFDYGIN